MEPGPTRAREADHLPPRGERAPVGQWIGFFLPPAVFFAHLQLNYVLVPWACTTHQRIWVHLTSLAAVLLALWGTLAAWRVHARSASDERNDDAGAVPRTRFLGVVGLCMGSVFVLLLVAQLVTTIVISPCE